MAKLVVNTIKCYKDASDISTACWHAVRATHDTRETPRGTVPANYAAIFLGQLPPMPSYSSMWWLLSSAWNYVSGHGHGGARERSAALTEAEAAFSREELNALYAELKSLCNSDGCIEAGRLLAACGLASADPLLRAALCRAILACDTAHPPHASHSPSSSKASSHASSSHCHIASGTPGSPKAGKHPTAGAPSPLAACIPPEAVVVAKARAERLSDADSIEFAYIVLRAACLIAGGGGHDAAVAAAAAAAAVEQIIAACAQLALAAGGCFQAADRRFVDAVAAGLLGFGEPGSAAPSSVAAGAAGAPAASCPGNDDNHAHGHALDAERFRRWSRSHPALYKTLAALLSRLGASGSGSGAAPSLTSAMSPSSPSPPLPAPAPSHAHPNPPNSKAAAAQGAIGSTAAAAAAAAAPAAAADAARAARKSAESHAAAAAASAAAAVAGPSGRLPPALPRLPVRLLGASSEADVLLGREAAWFLSQSLTPELRQEWRLVFNSYRCDARACTVKLAL